MIKIETRRGSHRLFFRISNSVFFFRPFFPILFDSFSANLGHRGRNLSSFRTISILNSRNFAVFLSNSPGLVLVFPACSRFGSSTCLSPSSPSVVIQKVANLHRSVFVSCGTQKQSTRESDSIMSVSPMLASYAALFGLWTITQFVLVRG